MKEQAERGRNTDFEIRRDGILAINDRLCIPNIGGQRKEVMKEAQTAPYTMHPEITKMYQTLRSQYWWPTMKKDVAEYIDKCLICQQIKAEHQASVGKLRPLTRT